MDTLTQQAARKSYGTPRHPLAEARLRAGMTMAQLSERSGLAQSTICRIERRQVGEMPGTMRKLAKALGVEKWTDLVEE